MAEACLKFSHNSQSAGAYEQLRTLGRDLVEHPQQQQRLAHAGWAEHHQHAGRALAAEHINRFAQLVLAGEEAGVALVCPEP